MPRIVNRLLPLVTATALLVAASSGPVLRGQQPVPAGTRVIPSLVEPGQGLAVRATGARSGLVTFAAATGRGLWLPGTTAAPALERALAFADAYGRPFGLAGRQNVEPAGPAQADGLGQEHVRLRQTVQGIPVTAGELVVHLRGDRVIAVNGRTVAGVPASLVPAVPAGTARDLAAELLTRRRPAEAAGASFSDPRLEIFNRGQFDEGAHPTRLAWFIEATGEHLREFIWLDAASGAVLLHFSQLAEARTRVVHDLDSGTVLPGPVARVEGAAAVAQPDVNQAYDFSGLTYDYFQSAHGRDSYDNAGGVLRSSVRYGVSYRNAYWNGQQMVYGEGYTSADDVVAHELTHAVTDRSANLFYYNQSGALNESFSDIFGEVVDLTDGVGNDTAAVRWQIAEDLPIGAIRNLMTPTAHGDPGKMSDSEFMCRSSAWTDPDGDNGGVHHNSGIPNHAFALMADGGTYNGRTITGIGLAKAAKVQYRALTVYLTSGATFADNARALAQACTDLTGAGGLTAADCAQVTTAVDAVEMASPWACGGAPPSPPPAFCPVGESPVPHFAEPFEYGGFSWASGSNVGGTDWSVAPGFAAKGTFSAWGRDVPTRSDHWLSMAGGVVVPPGGRLYFDHAFEFEHSDTVNFDGGVLEYSTDGTTWTDAAALIDGGVTYNGVLSPDFSNPLAGRAAFVRSTFGYTATRLNLASLEGESVRFRFRIGTDFAVGSLGWFVDNVQLYSCSSGGGFPVANDDAFATPFGTALTVAAPGVLANDNASGGGAMTAVLDTTVHPASGTLTLGGDGSVLFTPAAGFSGRAVFMYHVVNTKGVSPLGRVTIDVGAPPPPPPPTAIPDTYGTTFDTPLTVAAPGVLANDTGSGGGPLMASLITPPSNGTLAFGSDGAFTYTPAGGFVGTDSFTYVAANTAGPGNAATVTLTVADSPVPLPPSHVRVVAMNGNTVTFAWTLPAAGPAPASLQLEGGVAPAQVIGAVPLGVTPAASITLPTGSFYVRLRSEAGGVWSAPSNEVLVHVNVPEPPSAPVQLLGSTDGGTLGLSWTSTFAGGQPRGALLEVTGALTLSVPLGAAETFAVPGVPPGTYTFTVRQTGPGGASAPSNPVTLTFPSPCSGVPQVVTNFAAYKAGGRLFLRWDPPTGGAAVASYVLHVSGSVAGSLPMAGRAFAIDAPPGTFHLAIAATNACGVGASTPPQTVTFP